MRVVLFRVGRPPDDEDTALDAEEAKRARNGARGLAALELGVTRIFTSPWRGSRDVAELLAPALGVAVGRVAATDALRPVSPPHDLFRLLSAFIDSDSTVAVVGHAGQLDRVLALALTGQQAPVTPTKRAGAALLELDNLPRPDGELIWLLPMKVLAKL